MSYTIHDAYFPLIQNALESLTAVLKKAETSSEPGLFITASIHSDMKPLRFQVYAVTKICQELAAKSSGYSEPKLEDDMASYSAFYARITETQAAIAQVENDVVLSRADALVRMVYGPGKYIDMPLFTYITGYAIPNILFHVTTAYDILRKEGLELGKGDFLAPFLKGYYNQN